MGDILKKLQMVCEKIGVTETAHTIEEQVDLISESLDKIPASTDIATALDDLSEVAQNINNEEVYVDKTITVNGEYLPAYDDATAYSKVTVNVAPPEFYPTMRTQRLMAQNELDDTWLSKTWNELTNFNGQYIWTDGDNIYYSYTGNQYVLNKSTSTWTEKIWTGLTNFEADGIWTDGDNIYYNSGGSSDDYMLDKTTSTWSTKSWTGIPSTVYGRDFWTDGDNIYLSSGSSQYYLPITRKSFPRTGVKPE